MSDKKNRGSLLCLCTADRPYGTERMVITVARGLARRGWAVRTVFPGTPESGSVLDWARAQGVEAEAGPASLHSLAPRTWESMRALYQLVRESRADIINLQYASMFLSFKDLLAIRLAGGSPCIVSIHGPVMPNLFTEQQRKGTRLAARLCRAIIVPSRWSYQGLEQIGVPVRKLHIVPNGVREPAGIPERRTARAALQLADDQFAIVTAGRLSYEKGMPDLIDAVARMPDPEGRLCLLLAGEGPDRAELERQAADSLPGRARFLGHLPDVSALFAAADVFALASHFENLALVYREAAFFGLPIVGTQVGGNAESITNGETGLLVPPKDPVSLAAALESLRGDVALRARLGEAARRRACAEFTEEAMIDGYEKVFEC